MLFQNALVALVGIFANLAAATPTGTQSPSQTSAIEAAFISYVEVLATQPAYLSIASAYATDTSAIAAISSWEVSVSSVIAAGETVPANFLSALPTGVQSFFGSVYTAEVSIASQNGFPVKATGSATPTKNAARETGRAVGVAAAGLAGFMGVVMAL